MPDPTFPLGQGGPGVLMVTPHWRPGRGEHSPQGQGTEAWGRSFTQSHIIHWELRGQGSPGPLPSMKANQTVKWDASTCWPCRVATFLPSLGSPGPVVSRLMEAQPTLEGFLRVWWFPQAGMGELWGQR